MRSPCSLRFLNSPISAVRNKVWEGEILIWNHSQCLHPVIFTLLMNKWWLPYHQKWEENNNANHRGVRWQEIDSNCIKYTHLLCIFKAWTLIKLNIFFGGLADEIFEWNLCCILNIERVFRQCECFGDVSNDFYDWKTLSKNCNEMAFLQCESFHDVPNQFCF